MKPASAILTTLRYSDYFSFPLTLEELHERLVKTPLSRAKLQVALKELRQAKKVYQSGNYVYLPGRKKNIALRESRQKQSRPLLARARALAKLIGHCPFVRGVFLTGSLAVENSRGGDDIDFMIIAENGHLWTARLGVTMLTELFGLRRHPRVAQARGKVCLNLYLCPSSFTLPTKKQSLYTAYELIQTVPLYDPLDLRTHLLVANPWLHDYLPNVNIPQLQSPSPIYDIRLPTPVSLLEKLCYHFQAWYMQRRRTREYITKDAAFFHPENPGDRVLQKLKELK